MTQLYSRPSEAGGSCADSTPHNAKTLHQLIAALDANIWSAGLSTRFGLLGSLLILLILIGEMLAHEHASVHLALIAATATGFTIFVLAIAFDLRTRQRFQARLYDLACGVASREQQIGSMLHDIRDPLSTLASMINLIADKNLDEQLRANLLTRIAASATSTDLRVKNALDLYLLDAQHLSASRRPIDIVPLIQEIVERYAPEARLKQLTLDYQCEALPSVELDPLHFERIVSNLVSDALAHASAGTVSITTWQNSQWLMLQIADHGAVLSPSELRHLFDRPGAAANNCSPAALARYVTQRLVELDGGFIEAASGTGDSLLVTLRLPVSVQASADGKTDPRTFRRETA